MLDFQPTPNVIKATLFPILVLLIFAHITNDTKKLWPSLLIFVPSTPFSERTRKHGTSFKLVYCGSPVMTTFLAFLIATVSMLIPVAIGALFRNLLSD